MSSATSQAIAPLLLSDIGSMHVTLKYSDGDEFVTDKRRNSLWKPAFHTTVITSSQKYGQIDCTLLRRNGKLAYTLKMKDGVTIQSHCTSFQDMH